MNTASIVALTLALAAGHALAQPSDKNAEADAALDEGRRLYDLREWDQAIAKFKEAYRLRADAPALYNIAQAYRLKGDCARAATFYKTFKRNFPEEKNVDKFIADMEECAKKQPAMPEPVEPKPEPEPEPTPAPAVADATPPATDGAKQPVRPPVDSVPEEGSAGRGMRLAGLTTAGIGLVALGVGVGFGLRAQALANDAENLLPGAVWDPTLETRGESAQRASRLFLIGGGVALVAGGALYVLGRKQASETPSVALVPTGDGASVAWSGRF